MFKFQKNFKSAIIYAIILSIVDSIGATYLRKYYLKKTTSLLYPIITAIAYASEIFILFKSYSYVNLTVMNTLWNAVQNSLIPIIGVFFFKEKVNKKGWLGIFLTIIGGILIGLE